LTVLGQRTEAIPNTYANRRKSTQSSKPSIEPRCVTVVGMRADGQVEKRPGQVGVPDFEEFFRTTYPSLVRLLSVAGEDPEDAVQEAFVQAHLHWPKISTYDDPGAWVRLVAFRRLLNRQRGRSRLQQAEARLGSSAPLADSTTAPPTFDLAEEVRRLPAQQRAAVALFYFADLSTKEVAQTMDVSLGTVKASLFAARRTLRMHLEDDDAT
jgi:RNA polymerase sigma-70 factor (ECF subfamily)